MSKLNKKEKHEEIIEDINKVLNILDTFENTPLDKTDKIIEEFNLSTQQLEKKYLKKDLDTKE